MIAKSFRPLTVIVVLSFGFLGTGAKADIVTPLGFQNGLTGWTVSDTNFVTVTNDQATMTESDVANSVTLSYDFVVADGAKTLSFTLVGLVSEPSGVLPAAFNVALLNPTTEDSLVNTVSVDTTAFYIRDLVDGVDAGEAATGVTLSPSTGIGFPLTVTLDISTLTVGTNAQIRFILLGGDIDNQTSVTLENVVVTSNSLAIPEPSSVVLATIGFLGFAGYGYRRSRKPIAA